MARDVLMEEFFSHPAADAPPGSLVVRPSLWVAPDLLLRFVWFLAASASPVLMPWILWTFVLPPEAREGGLNPDFIDWTDYLDFSVGIVPLLAYVFRPMFTRYILSEDGIRVRSQFLAKTDHRVEWSRVTAVRERHTYLDRLFGLSRLDIVSYGKRRMHMRLVGLRRGEELRAFVARKMRQSASVRSLFEND